MIFLCFFDVFVLSFFFAFFYACNCFSMLFLYIYIISLIEKRFFVCSCGSFSEKVLLMLFFVSFLMSIQ